MKLFPYGHATHPQWQFAAALVLAQLRAQMAQSSYASSPTLALLYITDHYSNQAQDILDFLSAELPEVTDWSGTVGVGIASNNVEYFDEPALCVMLCDVPAHQYRVFSGVAPLAALEDRDGRITQRAAAPSISSAHGFDSCGRQHARCGRNDCRAERPHPHGLLVWRFCRQPQPKRAVCRGWQ